MTERHAIYVGWVLGIARRHDLPLEPVFDEAGNYTDRLAIDIPRAGGRIRIVLVVPPPPPGWSLVLAE